MEPAPISTRVFPDSALIANAVVALLADTLDTIGRLDHPAALVLAGGRTPMEAYRILSEQRHSVSSHAHIAFSDDRWMPRDSGKSNAGNTEAYWQAMGFDDSRVHAIDISVPPEASATAFDADLRAFVASGGTIPLTLLGLGADGHTASLFSREDLARGEGRFAVAVHRPDGMEGISVTPEFLRHSERILFLVTGSEKQAMVRRLLHDPETIPAGLAVQGHPRVECWMDADASPND